MSFSKCSSMQKTILQPLKILFFWMAIWEVLYLLIGNDFLLVSPVQVVQALWRHMGQPSFWRIIFLSFFRILRGYVGGIFGGVFFGVLVFRKRSLYQLFYPAISTIKATPVASFILIALVWVKTTNLPSLIAFLMVFPIIFTNFVEGMDSVDSFLLEVGTVYRWSIWKKIRLLYLPSVAPYLKGACTLAMGMAWKAGIAAEVISCSSQSIGGKLRESKLYFETADQFAWTLVVILLSILLEKSLLFGMKAWNQRNRKECQK